MISNLMKRFAAATAIGCLMTPAAFGDYFTATIDGDFTEWATVSVAASDAVGDNTGVGTIDIGDIKIGNDDDFLYLSVTYPNSLSQSTNISIDVDSNPSTGYDVGVLGIVGVEASWQNDFPFTNGPGAGDFNNGFGMSGDFFGIGAAMMSPFGDAAQREWAISLDNTFNETGLPVFADDDFTVIVWADGGADYSVAIPYTLMAAPSAIPEPSSLVLISIPAIGLLARRRRS